VAWVVQMSIHHKVRFLPAQLGVIGRRGINRPG
jgi:hypothetical protein